MENKESYLKYQEQFKRINLFALIAHALSILLVLTVIFLPLFKCKYEILEIEFSKDVSIFNEICQNIKGFSSDADDASIAAISFIIFPALTVIMGGMLVFMSGKQLYACIQNLSNVHQMCMMEYVAIKKSGDTQSQKNFFKKQTVFSFLLYAIFAIFFAKIEGNIYPSPNTVNVVSQLAAIKGVSGSIVLVVLELGTFAFFWFKEKKDRKDVLVAITKEEFETKQEEKPVETANPENGNDEKTA